MKTDRPENDRTEARAISVAARAIAASAAYGVGRVRAVAKHGRAGLAFALVACSTTGCGARAASPASPDASAWSMPVLADDGPHHASGPRAPVLPVAARRLRFLFVAPTEGLDVARSVEIRAGLLRAGYQLVEGESAAHDADLVVRVAENGAATIVSLALVERERTVESLLAPVPFGTSTGANAALGDLVDRLTTSPRLGALAYDVERRHSARLSPRTVLGPVAILSDDDARARDDLAWSPLAMRHCRNPRSADACDSIASYLESFPEGAHAAEARATLQTAAPRIAYLRAAGK